MNPFTLLLDDTSATDHAKVGGKGANLGELVAAGFNVPPGFCVTTDVFWRFIAEAPRDIYLILDRVTADDIEQLRKVGNEVRTLLEQVPLPAEIAEAVVKTWQKVGKGYPYAIRSSATAEDLPYASFAGQHDTYLNVQGEETLLASVKACLISLFTDRAILYRVQNGFDHRKVALAVVVQRMVQSDVSGILFTADPVSGNRNIASIDASFGLGEALVSGLVSADLYQVDKPTHQIIKRQIASKQMAIHSMANGGTEQIELHADKRTHPALTDEQIIKLTRLGCQIEAHFGKPQDIEWALADGIIYITQSRPITSLYPLPQPQPEDDALHVYVSISHQQGMTDAMPPLAHSMLRTLLPVGHSDGQTESRYVVGAGGRLYGDVSPLLRHPVGRRFISKLLAHFEPVSIDPLIFLAKRPSFKSHGERFNPVKWLSAGFLFMPRIFHSLFWDKTEGATNEALTIIETHCEAFKLALATSRDLRGRLEVAVHELHRIINPVFTWASKLGAGMIAAALLETLMQNHVDEKDLIALGRGLSGNIETEMNLAVGDLADAARASDDLLTYLRQTHLDAKMRLTHAADLPGGEAFLQAWHHFIAVYGARGPSEIDLSRPRWAEDPSSLLQMVLYATKTEKPGAHRVHFQNLIAEAEIAAERVVNAARKGWLGWVRAPLVRRLIHVSRDFVPLRGYHKYLAVRMLALVKPVLLEAGETLQHKGKLEKGEDIWFMTLPEILDALNTTKDLKSKATERRSEFEHYQLMTPPHVITSEGEIPAVGLDGSKAPDGALVGNPVSAGVVEGVAKVVLDPGTDVLNPGEILVTPFTDPGWTPLFVNAAGLVTEVGGLMTHGSVVAREYGIPAVVGVADATKKINTGKRIRVHGDAGYVELID